MSSPFAVSETGAACSARSLKDLHVLRECCRGRVDTPNRNLHGTRHKQPVRRRIPELFVSPPNGQPIVMYSTRGPNAPIQQQHLDIQQQHLDRPGESSVKPSLPLPEILASTKQSGILDPMAAPPLSDDLRARFGPVGHAGQHAPLIAEPQARELSRSLAPGAGCRAVSPILTGCKALLDGRDCIVDIPGSRWDPQKFLDPSGRAPGRSYLQTGECSPKIPRHSTMRSSGSHPERRRFWIRSRACSCKAPWEAFEDAGEPPTHHAGARTLS